MKEEHLLSEPHLIMYDLQKKLAPDARVKIYSPPRLETKITKGIRDAAVKAFQVDFRSPYCLEQISLMDHGK